MILKDTSTIGIGLTNDKLKMAAILVDKVLPLNKDHGIPQSLICETSIDQDLIDDFIKKDKQLLNSDLSLLMEKIPPSFFISGDTIGRDEVRTILKQVWQEGYDKANNLRIIGAARQINAKNQFAIPIFNESILLNKLIEDYKLGQVHNKIEIEFINAPVIDVSKLGWNQIAEANEDPDFKVKAKRFGIFIDKNYQGKSLNFIVDDLSLQLEDYRTACSKHGIEVSNGTLKSLADSKSFFGTLV